MLPRALILLVLVWMPGCAYLSNRARDAGHCVLMDVQVGVGLSADVKVGPPSIGIGANCGLRAAGKTSWASPMRVFRSSYVGLPLWLGLMKDSIENEPVGAWKGIYFKREYLMGAARGPMLSEQEVKADRYGAEVGVFAGIVGVRIGFNVAEFGDFVTGWFGLDILGDDLHEVEKEKPPDRALHPLYVCGDPESSGTAK